MALHLPEDLDARVRTAVRHFWSTRTAQARKQQHGKKVDQGARSAVTGGAQMDGFIDLFARLIRDAGMPEDCIHRFSRLELPGFYRPTKEWDLFVVRNRQLICALEAKSQVGPSFGDNFNNRAEEAIGSAIDLWEAYAAKAFNTDIKPWLGYLFLLKDCPRSQSPVSVQEPYFQVFPEFRAASYAKRYELLCRKLVREHCFYRGEANKYSMAVFLLSESETGAGGAYSEPAPNLTSSALVRGRTLTS